MRRRYSQQTQFTQSTQRKRKYSHISIDSNCSNVLTSCSQQPKRRRLTKKKVDDSPFFTQPSITNLSNIDNANTNNDNHNKNENHNISTSDLAFLHENAAMFTGSSLHLDPEPPDFDPIESPMLARTLFKSNEKNDDKQEKEEIEYKDNGIPDHFLDLDNITWQNLVTREIDEANKEKDHHIPECTDDILTPALTPETQMMDGTDSSFMLGGNYQDIKIIMNATENQKAAKVNEELRNTYQIKPIIRSLDFVDYVIGDSIAVIRRKETDMVKGEQISTLKRIMYHAADRYKQIIFILQRKKYSEGFGPKHRNLGIGAAKKLDKNLQQIALSPRIALIECLESEQVAETIVYYLKQASKENKNGVKGVPLFDDFDDEDGINAQKLTYLSSLPQVGYSEAIWLLKEFNFNLQNIINCPDHKLVKAVPSLEYNDRHKFMKAMMKHKWESCQQDDQNYNQYMEDSSAVKQRKLFKRININNDSDSDSNDNDLDIGGVSLHHQ